MLPSVERIGANSTKLGEMMRAIDFWPNEVQ